MKKLFMMMAVALVSLGTAQAQTEIVQKMVVKQADGKTYKFNLSDVDEVTFEEKAVTTPTTVEEAKQMFIGQWKMPLEFARIFLESDDDEDAELYFEFKEDGTLVVIYYLSEYGMYVGNAEASYSIEPDSSDPSQGKLITTGEYGYRDLNNEGFTYFDFKNEDVEIKFTRMDIPVEYVLVEDD